MTPRELLDYRIDGHVANLTGCSFLPRTRKKIHDDLAIGRWVSVEERLPVIDSSGKWAGYTKDLEGLIAFGYYDYHNLCVFYSAWLELSMPSGKEEA